MDEEAHLSDFDDASSPDLGRLQSAPFPILHIMPSMIQPPLLTSSQMALWESLDSPHMWPYVKFRLVQNLQAYLIELFRKAEGHTLDRVQLVNKVQLISPHLFRRNNARFSGNENFDKVVTGMLHGAGFFEKLPNGKWRLTDEKARVWEEKQLRLLGQNHPEMFHSYH